MGNVLVWGNLRGLIDGDLPQGVPAQEVDTLATLRERLEGRPSALVLLDPAKLEAEAEAFAAWHAERGSELALFVAVSNNGHAEDVLQKFTFLDDAVAGPIRPGLLKLRLTRALDTIHSRRVIRQLEATISRKGRDLHELNKIGVALSAERDIDKLLETILRKSREITAADAGSLYLVERPQQGTDGEPHLRFKLAQNDSVSFPFEEATMPLDDRSIELFFTRYRDRSVHPTDRRYTYYPPMAPLPAQVAPGMGGKGFDLAATIDRPAGAGGVLFATGTENSGLSVFVQGDRLVFDYNCFNDHHVVESGVEVPVGPSVVGVRFRREGAGATAVLYVDGVACGDLDLPFAMHIISSVGPSVGYDHGSPVSERYSGHFPFEGTLHKVDIAVVHRGAESSDLLESQQRAAMAQQ